MATKKKAVAKKPAVKKAPAKTFGILAEFEEGQFAGSDRDAKLEALRAAVEETLRTKLSLSKGLTPELMGDFVPKVMRVINIFPYFTTLEGLKTRTPKPPKPPGPKP